MLLDQNKHTSLLLRLGLAFTLFYAAIGGFINPNSWIGFFPPFLTGLIPTTLLLTSWGIVEIIVALWLLSNKKVFYPAVISALMMLGIVIFNFGAMDIVFRDVAILFMAAALATLTYDER